MPAGTRIRVHAGHADDSPTAEPRIRQRFAATFEERGQLSFPPEGARLRLVGPSREVEHQRKFLPATGYRPVPVKVLRNADQTAFSMLASDLSSFAAGVYRLRLTFHRHRQTLSEAGVRDPEHVTLDLPWDPVDVED